MKALRLRTVLVAIAVLVFAISLVVPSTGWVLRTQLRMLVSTFPEKALLLLAGIKPERIGLSPSEADFIKAETKKRLHQASQQHPDKEKMQIAFCVLTEPISELPVHLRDLLKRFPNSPLLHATILRYDCYERIRLRREGIEVLSKVSTQQKPSFTPPEPPPPNPQHITDFERIAAKGEQLDPDNAFFPMMRAIGLFAAHRDDDALKALIRASKKKRWDDYKLEEREGTMQLWESAFGKPNGLTKSYIAGLELVPHIRLIRAMTRVAVHKAVELERKGKLAEGLEIRSALIRCAQLMREQQKSRLPSLIAPAIAHIALVHPKGEPLPEPKGRQERGELIQVRFINYLQQIGQAEKAKWVKAGLQANEQVRNELHQQVLRSPFLDTLAFVWLMGLTFLSAIAILLAVWFGATIVLTIEQLVARIKQTNVSEQKPMKFGLVLLFAIWLMMAVWLWEVSAIKHVWSVYEVIEELSGMEELFIPPQIWQAFLLTLVVVGTLTLMLIAGLFGRLKGLPISRAVVQGIRLWTPPMAATISLLYAVILIVTAVWEGRLYIPL